MYEKWKSTSRERHHVCKFTSGGERFFIDDSPDSEYYSFLIEPQRKSFASNLWSGKLFTSQFRVSKELKISAITQHDFQYQKLKASAWTTIKPLTIPPVRLRMLVENTLSKHVNHLICRWNLFCTFRLFFSLLRSSIASRTFERKNITVDIIGNIFCYLFTHRSFQIKRIK